MSWSSLPDDIVELILARLSLKDFVTTRMFVTCHSFHAAYRKRIILEHKSFLDLADKVVGHARITCLVRLIVRFLKGDVADLGFAFGNLNGRWISADGVLCGPAWFPVMNPAAPTMEDLRVLVCKNQEPSENSHVVLVEERKQEWGTLSVHIPRDRRGFNMYVHPSVDGVREAMAVVQAMLSMGLAEFILDTEKQAVIRFTAPADGCRCAGMQARIQPLLPFPSRSTSVAKVIRDELYIVERIQIGLVPNGAG
jgi:hypothetical protein